VLAELVVQCSKQQTDGGEPLLAVAKLASGPALALELARAAVSALQGEAPTD